MYFPSICVDNFFNNPDSVRELAMSLEFKSSTNRPWPGKRSASLSTVSQNYFHQFCDKLFSLTFDFKKHKNISWAVDTYFQLIEPDSYMDINKGWVHQDHCIYAGVIYLTPGIDLECGTSLYKPKKSFEIPINQEYKEEMFLNFSSEKEKEYLKKLEENNLQFVETAKFNNVYNRLVAYDGHAYHAVNNFSGRERKPRLTQVFFVEEISSTYFPIPSSKQVHI